MKVLDLIITILAWQLILIVSVVALHAVGMDNLGLIACVVIGWKAGKAIYKQMKE